MHKMIEALNELNLDLSCSTLTSLNTSALNIESDYLRDSILDNVESNIGSHVLKLSLPIEEYSRYKNNSISSFIRKNGSIKEHVGHQELKTADIVDTIFYKVDQYYTQKIFQEFRGFFKNLQSAVSATEHNIINTINYNFDREYINELSSITEFFEEIYEDIGDISSSRPRCNSYLNHVISNRQKIIKLIKHFLDKLWSWPNKIIERDFYNNNYYIVNYNELSNDYLLCRQAISNYAICLVFEHILAGNIGEDSKNKVIAKIQKNLQKFKDVDRAIKNSLRERDAGNYQDYYWYNSYQNNQRSNDRAGINWFIQQCKNEENFEVKEVSRLFKKSKTLLANIIIK